MKMCRECHVAPALSDRLRCGQCSDRIIRAAISRERELEAVRDGRKHRAVTIPNKKKQAQIDACRKRKDHES